MNLKRVFYISLLLLLSSSYYSFSESTKIDSIISISGQILHSESLTSIPLATITIKRTRKGAICDSLGIFHLQIQLYDTLRISALGYKPKEWMLPAKNNSNNPVFTIKLDEISYLLKEVRVSSWKNWTDFKEEFIRTKAPKEDELEINFKMSEVDMRNIKDAIAVNNNQSFDFAGALIYYGIKLFEKKKIPEVVFSKEIQELHEQILAEKYNNKIIKQLTNQEDSELEKLREFINRNTNFTYETNEITIQTKVVELYEKYKNSIDITKFHQFKIDTLRKIPNHLKPF